MAALVVHQKEVDVKESVGGTSERSENSGYWWLVSSPPDDGKLYLPVKAHFLQIPRVACVE